MTKLKTKVIKVKQKAKDIKWVKEDRKVLKIINPYQYKVFDGLTKLWMKRLNIANQDLEDNTQPTEVKSRTQDDAIGSEDTPERRIGISRPETSSGSNSKGCGKEIVMNWKNKKGHFGKNKAWKLCKSCQDDVKVIPDLKDVMTSIQKHIIKERNKKSTCKCGHEHRVGKSGYVAKFCVKMDYCKCKKFEVEK